LKVIGIELETTTEYELVRVDLASLWKKFNVKSFKKKIHDTISDDFYIFYHNYNPNNRNEFTLLVGCLVKTLENVPQGLTGREFTSQKFVRIISASKSINDIHEIWNHFNTRLISINRKFSYDYIELKSTKDNYFFDSVKLFVSINEN